MNLTAVLVLYAVIWFMVLFVVLPLRLKTQADVGEIVPGTPASAPAEINLKKKAKIVTLIATVLWLVFSAIIQSGVISVRDLDWFERMGPAPIGDTNG